MGSSRLRPSGVSSYSTRGGISAQAVRVSIPSRSIARSDSVSTFDVMPRRGARNSEKRRAFSLGHAAELDMLRASDTGVDWLVLAPPPVFLDDEDDQNAQDGAGRAARYRIGGSVLLTAGDDAASFSYSELAVALVDEIETPGHHRMLAAVAR